MGTEVKKVKVVGNKTTEVIIGSAASKLQIASKALSDAVKEAQSINTLVEEGTLKVVNIESEISELKTKFNQEKSKLEFDLDLAYKTKETELVSSFLSRQGLVSIKSSDLQAIKVELDSKTKEFDTKVNAEIGKTRAILVKDHENDTKILKLEHQNKESANTARITQLEEQNKFLLEQVESWKKSLDSERTAGIERSKANAIGTLNLGTNK